MFSGRIIGVPDLYTIGACTGRTMALVSPQGKGVSKPFNWGRVVRHELVHIFNLEQTEFQVPHWLTEGLAVRNEGYPRAPQWDRLLKDRAAEEALHTLSTINLGFIRPRSPGDRPLAYVQSLLYVEYLTDRFGKDFDRKMLAAYKDGLDTPAALRRVCGVEPAAIEAGYREHVQAIIKAVPGKPAEKAVAFSKLQEANAKNPDDADTAAKLAEQLLRRKKAAEARKLADGVLAKQPNHPLANLVKAKLMLAAGDDAAARKLLEAGAAGDPPNPRLLLELGKMLFEAKEFDKAAEVFERGRSADPLEGDWLEQLAKTYAHTGRKEKQTATLKALADEDPDDLTVRVRLAKLLYEAKDYAGAEQVARDGLFIDVNEPELRAALLQSLALQKKDAEEERMRKLLGE
jgi:Tfp pilus assembly protein PilF